MPKDIKITNYTGDVNAILSATPDKNGTAAEKIAWYAMGLNAGSGYENNLYVNGMGLGLDPATKAYLAAMQTASSTLPAPDIIAAIDAFIKACKSTVVTGSTTIWDRLAHVMLFRKTGHTLNARINMKSPGTPASILGTLTFDDAVGYTGTASGMIDTGFNLSTSAIYTQNSAIIGFWALTMKEENKADIGARVSYQSQMSYIDANNSGTLRPYINTNSTLGTTAPGVGLIVTDRSANNLVRTYNNGTKIGDDVASDSVGIASLPAYVFAMNANGSTNATICRSNSKAFAMSIIGGSIEGKHAEFYNACRALMTACGVA